MFSAWLSFHTFILKLYSPTLSFYSFKKSENFHVHKSFIYFQVQLLQVGMVNRPMLDQELSIVYFILQAKVFTFDKVLKPNVSQDFVYTVSAKPIVAGKCLCLSN